MTVSYRNKALTKLCGLRSMYECCLSHFQQLYRMWRCPSVQAEGILLIPAIPRCEAPLVSLACWQLGLMCMEVGSGFWFRVCKLNLSTQGRSTCVYPHKCYWMLSRWWLCEWGWSRWHPNGYIRRATNSLILPNVNSIAILQLLSLQLNSLFPESLISGSGFMNQVRIG